MSQKRISLILFIILLTSYISLYMWQQAVFFQKNQSFYDQITSAMSASKQGEWSEANEQIEEVEDMWERGKVIISIKSGGTNQALLNIALKQMKGAVKERDTKSVMREGETAMMLFENLTSVSPRY